MDIMIFQRNFSFETKKIIIGTIVEKEKKKKQIIELLFEQNITPFTSQ